MLPLSVEVLVIVLCDAAAAYAYLTYIYAKFWQTSQWNLQPIWSTLAARKAQVTEANKRYKLYWELMYRTKSHTYASNPNCALFDAQNIQITSIAAATPLRLKVTYLKSNSTAVSKLRTIFLILSALFYSRYLAHNRQLYYGVFFFLNCTNKRSKSSFHFFHLLWFNYYLLQ